MADYYVDGSGDAIPVLVNLEAYKGLPPLAPLAVTAMPSSAWLTTSPVTLADMKTYLRVDDDAEDALITSFMNAAVAYCQDVSNKLFVETLVTATYADFPASGVPLLAPSASRVVSGSPLPSITYVDTTGATAQMAFPADFSAFSIPPGIGFLPTSGEWPDDYDRTGPKGVTLIYSVGGQDAVTAAQQWVAVKMLVGHWYATRDAVCDGNPKEVPFGVNALLQNNTFYGGLS